MRDSDDKLDTIIRKHEIECTVKQCLAEKNKS